MTRRRRVQAAFLLVFTFCLSSFAAAQFRADTFVTGLTNPVAFVQDPSDPAVQVIVQQNGRIRIVRAGVLQAADFLDLSSVITTGGERGLLGLAFSPDYATDRRFFVNFTDAGGHTVVARFRRSASDPLRADASSRFDLLWSTGERLIRQPFSNHNGGHLTFGPDGYLYIGMGDGGSSNDPQHLAQTPSSLLGKMLRVDVRVSDADPEGFDVPADNPFVAGGARPEIWSFGLRNPWRYNFDDPAHGGTGALVIADVGQNSWEEIDYEPAGRAGRNYGWRNREGAHDNVTSLPPAFGPLTEPIFEYSHGDGQSITGGFVYRGAALGSTFRGRYFFADFVTGRVWSLGLAINPSGDASASNVNEHTAALGGTATLGLISSFGVDSVGELYIVSWSRGMVLRVVSTQPVPVPQTTAPAIHIDTPGNGARVRQPFLLAGWALDTAAPAGTGIDALHVWAYPGTGAAPLFVGAATYGGARPDVGAAFGAQFIPSAFGLTVRGLAPGAYQIVAFGRLIATGTFEAVRIVNVVVEGGGLMAVDAPLHLSTVDRPFLIGGWALDAGAASGTGVDTIHIWAYPVGGGTPTFVGVAGYGSTRPDVGAFFGTQFAASGYNLQVSALPAGTWDLVVFAHSTVTGAFDTVRVVRVVVR
jgi:glucose/arabinose dehydrogenase